MFGIHISRTGYFILLALGCHASNLLDLLYRFKKKLDQIASDVEADKTAVHDCLFISSVSGPDCEKHLFQRRMCSRPNCSYRNLRKLVESLGSCRKTLDIAIHLISCYEIAEFIMEAALHRNIKVRILCDVIMARNQGSQVHRILSSGIDVRVVKDTCMHNKFAIMDSARVLIGSLNWTNQGLHGNWDSIVVTSQVDIVRDFVAGFEMMWEHPNVIPLK